MLIQGKLGQVNSFEINNRFIDQLLLEWYELKKKIMRKKTMAGIELSIKFLGENPALTEGDILYQDADCIIQVSVIPCDCMILKPKNMFEMASVCYEIGNKHLPLFYEHDQVLVPFEFPLFRLLQSQGYLVERGERKLLSQLNTTVSAHADTGGETLFSKIMKLKNPAS